MYYKIYILQACLLIAALYAAISFCIYDAIPEVVHFYLCNFFYFEGFSSFHIIWLVINLLLMVYLNLIMFNRNSGALFKVLSAIYEKQPSGSASIEHFFITSQHRFLCWRKNVLLARLIRRRLVPLANFYQVAIRLTSNLVIIAIFAYYHHKAEQLVSRLPSAQPLSTLAHISFISFSTFYGLVARVYVELCGIFCTYLMLLCYVFKIRLEQMWSHLHEGNRVYFGELRLKLHLRYNADSLTFLADFNRIYGRIMWAFFLVLYPENAVNWIAVLKVTQGVKTVSPLMQILFICSAIGLLAFIAVSHYGMIGLTRRIFQSAKYLVGVSVVSKNIRDFRVRLKLERYLDLCHTTSKPHSVTYGQLGNVSKASFGKSIFYYIKLLLFTNKLFN